jgi:carbon-monoxide dehydrogenase medium subunit
MKAPAFSYVRPQNLEDVIALMQEHGEEASLLAGGQTLHATLNMRLSEPGLLIDLQSVSELKGIQIMPYPEEMRITPHTTATPITYT